MNQNKQERFVFLDAWRGIAAIGVLMAHIIGDSVMSSPLMRVLPSSILRLTELGVYGVQIFFVLSGFVIAHSLRNTKIDSQSIRNFILRRQIRLDIPYWVIIILTLAQWRLEAMVPSLKTEPLPPFIDIVLNFLYLHELVGAKGVSPVAWTLCIEIQFYLAFILLLSLANQITRVTKVKDLFVAVAPLVFILGATSLVWIHISNNSTFFLYYWFYFALGSLCYWSIQRLISAYYFYGFIGIYLVSLTKRYFAEYVRNISFEAMLVALGFALLIYAVGKRGALSSWWNNKFMQYMGRNSYSLYLTHVPVLVLVLRVGYKITGENELMSIVWLIFTIFCCIGAAHLFHITIEKPSISLANRFKRRVDRPVSRNAIQGTGEIIPANGISSLD